MMVAWPIASAYLPQGIYLDASGDDAFQLRRCGWQSPSLEQIGKTERSVHYACDAGISAALSINKTVRSQVKKVCRRLWKKARKTSMYESH